MKHSDNEFIVDRPCGLLEFLFSSLGTLPRKKVKELLAHRSVVVDGHVTTQFNYALRPGQRVVIDRHGKFDFLQKNKISIIYENDEIIVINKPHGLLSVAADDIKFQKTAYNILNEYVRLSGKENRIFIVHRLDKDTSGVFLVSKSEKLKNLLQENWNNLVTERLYYAVVEGIPQKRSGRVTAYLKQDRNNMVYSSASGDGEKAVTEYSVIKSGKLYSLVDVSIETGKKNQIRVAMRDMGHAIAGDKKFGSKSNPLGRMGLHAYKLTLTHPVTGRRLSFETGMPKEFMHIPGL